MVLYIEYLLFDLTRQLYPLPLQYVMKHQPGLSQTNFEYKIIFNLEIFAGKRSHFLVAEFKTIMPSCDVPSPTSSSAQIIP